MFGSARAVKDPNDVTVEDYVADIRSWIRVIRKQADSPCVWVLGHSEGGLMALTANRVDAGICGLILVATAGRPFGQVLEEQLRSLLADSSLLEEALVAIAALEAGRQVDTSKMHPSLVSLFHPKVQGFLISEFAIDPPS